MLGVEEPKMFEFNTSTLLEKAFKALPSHFKFEETFFLLFLFFAFYFFWAAELWRRYLVRGIKVLLDTSLPQKFWYGSSGSTKSESITTVPENSGKRIGGTMILPLASL